MLKEIYKDILFWKRKYKDVFYIEIGKNLYVFRTLTRGEYFSVLDIKSNLGIDPYEFVLEECLLYPRYKKEDLENELAGEIDYLITCIVDLSGFASEKLLKDIEKERANISVLDNQIVLTICKAFPHLSPGDLDNLNYHQLLHYLVLAEEILNIKLNIEKPEQKDKIDFDQENRDAGIPTRPSVKKPKNKRGDVKK